jgi:ribosomal-protein-serine acetyltransferase
VFLYFNDRKDIMAEKIKESNHDFLVVDKHIFLRAVTEDEAGELFSVTNENRDYLGEFLPWVDKTNSSEDSLDFIKSKQSERESGSEFGFGVFYEEKLVGHASLMHITDGKTPEIGYWISQTESGKGITTKVARALERFGFDTLGVLEIVIKARIDNGPSNAIAEKLGFEIVEKAADEDGEEINVWRKSK